MLRKDLNIMSGKGEWDESEHPRDENGRFKMKPKSEFYKKYEHFFDDYAEREENGIDNSQKYDIILNEKFEKANSIKEAEAYARNVLGITICKFGDMDLELANQINECVYDAYKFCPKIKKTMNFIGNFRDFNKMYTQELKKFFFAATGINKLSKSEERDLDKIIKYNLSIPAEFDAFSSTILPNNHTGRKYNGIVIHYIRKSTYDNRLAKSVENGWHPQDCQTFKSVLDHELGHQLDAALNLSRNKEILELYQSCTKEEIKSGLSEYSLKSIEEFIAEGWTEYKNNKKPRRIASAIGKIIEKEVKNSE